VSEIWAQFCRELEQAGQAVLTSNLASGEMDRAEGMRYLSRLARVGLDMFVEHADPAFPSFYQASHATAKIGSDNPDNLYQNATISDDYAYRIWGTRGTVPILSFGTKANRYRIDGTMASTGELDIRDMQLGEDGSFELIVSREKQAGNWLPLEADSSMLIVRQTFFDKSQEVPAEVQIEALDSPGHPAPLDVAGLAEGLSRVPAFVKGTSETFIRWAELFRSENKNALSTVDQRRSDDLLSPWLVGTGTGSGPAYHGGDPGVRRLEFPAQ